MTNFNKFALDLSNAKSNAVLKVNGNCYDVKIDNITKTSNYGDIDEQIEFKGEVLNTAYDQYIQATPRSILNALYSSYASPNHPVFKTSGHSTPYTPRDLRTLIDKVIFNNPATIIIWKDGTKTVVRCQEGEIFDEEKGLAMAISKRALGDKGNFNEVFKEYVKNEPEKKEEPVADNRGKECEWRTSPVNSIFDFPTYECTACGNRHSMVMKPPAFCPDCGAKITNPKEMKK